MTRKEELDAIRKMANEPRLKQLIADFGKISIDDAIAKINETMPESKKTEK